MTKIVKLLFFIRKLHLLKEEVLKMEYYIRFSSETVAQAINCHSTLFKSIEDAIEHAYIEAAGKREVFFILDKNLEVVHQGITIQEAGNQ